MTVLMAYSTFEARTTAFNIDHMSAKCLQVVSNKVPCVLGHQETLSLVEVRSVLSKFECTET